MVDRAHYCQLVCHHGDMTSCACGCGGQPTRGRFLVGHQWRDPEIRERRAVQLRGRALSAEHRVRLSEVRTGVTLSEERKRAIARGRIAGWKKPYYSEQDCGFASPCWVWSRALLKSGYGALKRNGKSLRAHRWMYEQACGPIPDGLVLDHLCENKPCVNPEHLEPVTKRENERRHRQRHS